MTNLEKIKEILNKYTEPQDMDYYLHGCIMNEQFDDLAIELVKKLTLTDVSQQRELLIEAFGLINVHDGDKEKIAKLVDLTLKSINCA